MKAHREFKSTITIRLIVMSDPATNLTSAAPAADNILNAAEQLRAAAAARALQWRDALKTEDLRNLTGRVVSETTQRWREVSDNAAAFIKHNPGRAALAALGIGFAIGLLFRRD